MSITGLVSSWFFYLPGPSWAHLICRILNCGKFQRLGLALGREQPVSLESKMLSIDKISPFHKLYFRISPWIYCSNAAKLVWTTLCNFINIRCVSFSLEYLCITCIFGHLFYKPPMYKLIITILICYNIGVITMRSQPKCFQVVWLLMLLLLLLLLLSNLTQLS